MKHRIARTILFVLTVTGTPAWADDPEPKTAAKSEAKDDKPKDDSIASNVATCFGYSFLGLGCGFGGAFNLNIGQASVGQYNIAAVAGGHVVQPTQTYNNVPGLIAYLNLPYRKSRTDGFFGASLLDIAQCGPWAWSEEECGIQVVFTVPGTTGGFQQYGLAWKVRVLPSFTNPVTHRNSRVSLGIGAAISPQVPVLDERIVDENGMVRPAFDASVTDKTLLPTRSIDRWGVLFTLGIDFD